MSAKKPATKGARTVRELDAAVRKLERARKADAARIEQLNGRQGAEFDALAKEMDEQRAQLFKFRMAAARHLGAEFAESIGISAFQNNIPPARPVVNSNFTVTGAANRNTEYQGSREQCKGRFVDTSKFQPEPQFPADRFIRESRNPLPTSDQAARTSSFARPSGTALERARIFCSRCISFVMHPVSFVTRKKSPLASPRN